MFFFYRNSLARNLCKEYSREFKNDLDDNDKLFSLCLRQQSIPFFATACYQKWGLSADFLKDKFKDYINGKHTAKDCDGVNGYTYQLWCDSGTGGTINISCDITHIMNNICDIVVPKTKCPVVYVSNRSSIKLISKGYNSVRVYLFDESQLFIDSLDENSNILIYKYSNECNVIIGENCMGNIKQFNKDLRL